MLRLGKDFDAVVDSEAFARLYAQRLDRGGIKSPKAMDDAALRRGGDIARMVKEWRLQQSAEFEQELFKPAKRLADADPKWPCEFVSCLDVAMIRPSRPTAVALTR